jgi:hypothetical protein
MTRRTIVTLLSALAVSMSLACSSERTSGAIGTSGSSDSGISIETGSLYITIENRAGSPLSDVNVSIDAGGAPYIAHIAKLATGEKKDIPITTLKKRDGETLNLLAVRPRHVTVTGVDLFDKKHDVTVPWKS